MSAPDAPVRSTEPIGPAARARPVPWATSLPLPALGETGARYLELVRPRLTPEAFASTEAHVAELLRTSAPLQARLRRRALRSRGDYVGAFWRDMYLGRREPLAREQNAAVLFRLPDALVRCDLPARAAALAVAAGEIATSIADGRLPPDRDRGGPLCMAQHGFAFGTTRLPGLERDRLRRTARPAHFILAHRGRFYPLPLPPDPAAARPFLEAAIRAILADPTPGSRAGSLTSLPRPVWHACRERLRRDPGNAATLRAMERAAFLLCIDDRTDAADPAALARAALDGPAADRWYDKVCQFVLFAAPYLGINAEHSPIDGHAGCSLVETVLARIPPHAASLALTAVPAHRPLRWNLAEVADALDTLEGARPELALQLVDLPASGRPLRDDASVQLAVQLAHVRLTGRAATIYQPVHMRQHPGGRTEAVRSDTPAALAFCAAADRTSCPHELRALARAAVHDIVARLRDGREGRGVERHLFALLCAAREQGQVPGLFRDPAFAEALGPAVLCTSSLSGFPHLERVVFAPVRPDGFGVGYVVTQDRITLCVTGLRQDTARFHGHLVAAGRTVVGLLRGQQPGHVAAAA